MVTEALFIALVGVVALQRLAEVVVSRRHERALQRAGGRIHDDDHMVWMTFLHTAWLVAMPLEVVLVDRPLLQPLSGVALVVFFVGQFLRRAAMKQLGPRWTVRVVTVPGEAVETEGIFRHVRHPNYLGVVLEMAALPLVHGAWVTSLVFSVLNGLLLRSRIRTEERALAADEDYGDAFPGALRGETR